MKALPPPLLVRALAYGLVILYLAMDLFVLHGPLRQYISRRAVASRSDGATGPDAVAARIHGREITLREVDQAMRIAGIRAGQPVDPADRHPAGLFDRRIAALATLLDARAIDAKLAGLPALVDETAADALIAAEESRAGGPAALAANLTAAAMTRAEMRALLRAEAARSRYLEDRLAASGANSVDEAAVLAWLDTHKAAMILPARLKLRHIFKATLHKDPAAVHARMLQIHESLRAGSLDFAAAAATESEDLATNTAGGSLGWVEGPDPRLPDGLDFAALQAATPGVPLAPCRSAMGWHIFIVAEAQAAGPADPAVARAEVRALLLTNQRRAALPRILDALRREGDARIFATPLRTAPLCVD